MRNYQRLLVVFAVLLGLFNNCRKPDQDLPNQQHASQSYDLLKKQFFNTTAADPEVQKVAADIKKQDSVFKFLPGFAKKNGIPKWDKVLYETKKGQRITEHSGKGMIGSKIDDEDDLESQGIFLIPLQSTTSADIASYITAYKHNDSLYTYRLYNKDSLDAIHPDSFQAKKNLLNAEAVFGYFEKTINGKDSIVLSGPSNGALKNVEIGFSDGETSRRNNSTKEMELTCQISMVMTIEFEWHDFSWPAGDGVWVAVSMTLEIDISCTGSGGGGGCDCATLDPEGPGNYWWAFGTGWPWYNTGGWQGFYFNPSDPWYPWWTSGGGSSVNPFPPAEVTEVDVSQISDPCLLAVIAAIGAPGHTSYILKTYDQQQYTPLTPDRYKITYRRVSGLTGANGQAVPGHTDVNLLPDGTHEVVISLNPDFFGTTSKEWVTAVILHEMMHGILVVKAPNITEDISTQKKQHEYMFNKLVPITIYQSLKELFPNIDTHDALALGMDGMDDGYMIPDPNNPSSQIVDPTKNQFAIDNYYQNINQAVTAAGNYRTGAAGTPFC